MQQEQNDQGQTPTTVQTEKEPSHQPGSGSDAKEYWHRYRRANATYRWLWPVIHKVVAENNFDPRRALDLGCGNGATAEMIRKLRFDVVGIDHSESGIAMASSAYPDVAFHVDNAYDDLTETYGTFPLVVAMEVIEHLYDPRRFLQNFYALLDDNGLGAISTPYHGYWKNLALAVAGRWDRHLGPLRLHAHIKFFSAPQLRQLLSEVGFKDITIHRVGRIPPLAKSMVAVVRK